MGRVARTVSAGALQLVPHRREATSQAVSPLERSRALNRPLSPDLVIDQPQLTWVLSGFYRVSSIGLTTGTRTCFSLSGAPTKRTSPTDAAARGGRAGPLRARGRVDNRGSS